LQTEAFILVILLYIFVQFIKNWYSQEKCFTLHMRKASFPPFNCLPKLRFAPLGQLQQSRAGKYHFPHLLNNY